MSEEHLRFNRETSLWWIDMEMESIRRISLQIGAEYRPIPLKFRQPLLRTLQQLRKAVEEAGEGGTR